MEVNVDSPHVRSALAALQDEYGKPALLRGGGGSIPVVTPFRSIPGLDSILIATHAISIGSVLVTNDKVFRHVPELQVED